MSKDRVSRKEAEERDRLLREALQAAMASDVGRRLLLWIIGNSVAGLTAPSFLPGDALGTAHREGRRAVAIDVIRALEQARPGAWSELMVFEAAEERRLRTWRDADKETDE